jgi:uncharacterized protein YdhG (YjbR/CyaY superfamily)
MQYINIDEYIATCPKDVQRCLHELRRTIHEAAPDAEEAISYQMPTFKLHGNLVHFAAFNNHISLFPAGAGLEPLAKQIAPYRTGKGTLQFPLDKPMPLGLVKRIVKLRVKENVAKDATKAVAKAGPKRTRRPAKTARRKAKG